MHSALALPKTVKRIHVEILDFCPTSHFDRVEDDLKLTSTLSTKVVIIFIDKLMQTSKWNYLRSTYLQKLRY